MRRLLLVINAALLLCLGACANEAANSGTDTTATAATDEPIVGDTSGEAPLGAADYDSILPLPDSTVTKSSKPQSGKTEMPKDYKAIHHNSTNQSQLDSMKASKTKGKFK